MSSRHDVSQFRRVLWFIMAVLLGVAIGPAPGALAQVEIEVWLRGNPQYLQAYEALGEMFMKENPDIKVRFTLYQDLEDKLITAAAGGALPDAWIMDTVTTGRWVRYNLVAPIDRASFPDQDKILEIAWETNRGADGKYYGVPWNVQGQAMYYRKDWLEKWGQPVPRNWDEMIAFAKFITEEDPDGDGRANTYGIGVYGSTNRGYAYWTFQDWLWQAGGSILRSTGPDKWVSNLDTEATRTALKFMRSMAFEHKVFQPGFATAQSSDVYGVFQDGVVGMVFHAGYRILEYRDRLGDRVGTALMPAGPVNGWTLGEGENLYMSRTTKHPDAVMRWMQWMTTREAQIFGFTNTISNVVRVTVRKDIDQVAIAQDPLLEPFVEVFRQDLVRFPEPVPDYYPIKILASELAQKVLLSENADIDALIREYDQKINAELRKQGVFGG